MVDPTRRTLGLKAQHPEFFEECRQDLRDGGPERLEMRADRLERRVQELTETAEQRTSWAKQTLLRLLRRYHDNAGDYAGDLKHVAGTVAKGTDHPLFDQALSAEKKRRQSGGADETNTEYEWLIRWSVESRRAAAVARGKLRLVEYLLDDWGRGAISPEEDTTNTDEEELLKRLYDLDGRMEYIQSELREYGQISWKETYDKYEDVCQELGKKNEYSNHDSLKAAYHRWRGKQK